MVRPALATSPLMRYSSHQQTGVALAILVWFLAAMSLLVAGIVMQARVDIKLAQLHVARAQIEAAADGAIQLALAQLMQPAEEGTPAPTALQSLAYALGGFNVTVNITPVSGLININKAPEGLLFLLFSTVEGVDESAAHELALRVVEWRSAKVLVDEAAGQSAGNSGAPEAQDAASGNSDNVRHARFEANEDLLLVAGIDRRIYEAVQDAVYVGQEEQSGVDWMSAPVAVLRGLLGGDEAAAQELAEVRVTDKEEGLVAPEGMDLSFQEASIQSSYRMDAVVEHDGSVFNRRRWVDRERSGSDDLPWSFFRTEALRVLPSAAGSSGISGEVARAGS